MENLLLLLIILVIIIIIFNHKHNKEPFYNANNDLIIDKLTKINNLLTSVENQNDENIQDSKSKTTNLLSSVNNAIMKTNITPIDLTDLHDEVDFLGREYNNIKTTKPRSLKSYNNGAALAISNIKSDKYLVHLNNGCLGATLDNNYKVYKCNSNDAKQKFQLIPIFDESNYNYNLTQGLDKVNPGDNLKYPFSIVKSVNNENCLSNNHNKITIEPCRVLKSQRWKEMDTIIDKCL